MAKGFYTGVSNVARKGKKAYIGVDNVARKVKKIYAGVNGVAKLSWNSAFTTATVTSGTLPAGYQFYGGGTDVAVPYNGNSNVLEWFTGIIPTNKKTYLYNISENTFTESSKETDLALWAYNGFASSDGYMYFLGLTEKIYKLRQSDFSTVLTADSTLDSETFHVIDKCIVEIGNYIYYLMYYVSGDDYRIHLYSLDKNTLAITKAASHMFELSHVNYIGMTAHNGEIYIFYNSKTDGKSLNCYKYSAGSIEYAFGISDSPFGTNTVMLRAMEMDGETYLFVGTSYIKASKIYKVNYESKTVSLFATLNDGVYVDTWLFNGDSKVISTYNYASSANFTILEFK